MVEFFKANLSSSPTSGLQNWPMFIMLALLQIGFPFSLENIVHMMSIVNIYSITQTQYQCSSTHRKESKKANLKVTFAGGFRTPEMFTSKLSRRSLESNIHLGEFGKERINYKQIKILKTS